MAEILYFIAGLALGALFLWLVGRLRRTASENLHSGKLEVMQEQLMESRDRLDSREKEVISLSAELAASKTDLRNQQLKVLEQSAQLEELQKKLSLEFENLANRILEEKTKKFTEQNKTSLDELLKPFSERLKEFREKVDNVYGEESRQRFHLGKEIEKLVQLNQLLGEEAKNLTRALKGESKTQGNWGEMILENILEKSGLVKNREYEIQPSFTNQEGKRLQPDVLVRYPGNRTVVIDSKVSLSAYERFVSAESQDERERAVKDHLLSVKKHIQELDLKGYEKIFSIQSLDFVMLFLPVEPAYFLALQADPLLWNYAYDRRILLMSPTNLLAALKMIESLWRIENQNENAKEIARQSGDMLDKFVSFVEDLNRIGSRLNDAHAAWDESMKKLQEGRGNLIGRARKIRELGAKSRKELPGISGNTADSEEENGS